MNDTSTQNKTDGWKSLYPFESSYLPVDSYKIHYLDEGNRSANPIVMVHGNPTWSFYWRRMIKELGGEHRCVAIDHVGCGLSDKPAGVDYCLETHRDNLCRLIDHLDLQNATLMAHDWGGAIGLAALLERKERFKRIILFNTGAFPPPSIPFRIQVCRWPLVGTAGVRGLNLFARAAVTMATTRKGGLIPEVAAGMLAPYDSWKNRIAIDRFVKDIPSSKSHRTWSVLETIENSLSSLQTMPKLLCWGMKDWCFDPACLKRFESHWPGAEVHRFESAGHYVVEDAADELGGIVSGFLQRTT